MNNSFLAVPSLPISTIDVSSPPGSARSGGVQQYRRPSRLSFGRRRKSVRPKPRLDEATLRLKQEWAARGLTTIMRRKIAERRRAVYANTAAASNYPTEAVESGSNVDVESNRDKSSQQSVTNSYIISAIPYMPKSVASLCLILNILLPGSGTMLSGLTVMCCGKSRMIAKEDQYGTTCCVNLMVGTMQLFTVTFMLVGWIWSLVWGIYMIILADEMQKEQKDRREKELQAQALVAMNNKLRVWTMVGRNK